MRDLAAEVGILSGSIFHHFKNKEEILFAVMSEVVVAMDAALKSEIEEAGTTLDKLRSLIYIELQFIHGKTSNATAVLIHEWRALKPEQQQQILSSQENYFSLWEEVLEQAKSEGILEVEPAYLRHMLHGALIWTSHWYQADGELSIDDLTERFLTLAIKSDVDR